MMRSISFLQYLAEASTDAVQRLIAKLQNEAASEKMRIGGTVDKLPWAMKFAVLNAFVQKLQADLAAGEASQDGYGESLYKAIEGRDTELKRMALDSLKQNGLDSAAADKLDQSESGETPVNPESQLQPQPAQPAPVAQPQQNESLNEAWKLVKLLGNLQSAPKPPKPEKSPAEKEFRTAFNHARNICRKYLEHPKEEPVPNVRPDTQSAAPTGQPDRPMETNVVQ